MMVISRLSCLFAVQGAHPPAKAVSLVEHKLGILRVHVAPAAMLPLYTKTSATLAPPKNFTVRIEAAL